MCQNPVPASNLGILCTSPVVYVPSGSAVNRNQLLLKNSTGANGLSS